MRPCFCGRAELRLILGGGHFEMTTFLEYLRYFVWRFDGDSIDCTADEIKKFNVHVKTCRNSSQLCLNSVT